MNAADITQLFILFHAGDKKLISALKLLSPNGIINGQWHFSIADLSSFHQSYYQLAAIDYLLFRKALFNSPINDQLKAKGLCISIAKPAKNVDQTIYYLRQLNL